MSRHRSLAVASALLLTAVPLGCHHAHPMVRRSQLQAMQLYQRGSAIAMERDQVVQQAGQLSAQNAQLASQNAQMQQRLARMESDLDISHRRMENLAAERSSLHERYVSLLKKANDAGSPLSPGTTHRFEELARRYPDFDFDPQTGVSKFHSDILFDTGSDAVKPGAVGLLREFAAIMNDGDACNLNILVVGHTDDKPIKGTGPTSQRHPTNWHLSTNRADSVVLTLKEYGLAQNRMGAAGYSMFQPVAANNDEHARQANRRVEIFVLAPDATIAGWDPSGIERR